MTVQCLLQTLCLVLKWPRFKKQTPGQNTTCVKVTQPHSCFSNKTNPQLHVGVS